MTTDRAPTSPWARRLRAEREARLWSQRDVVRALRIHSPEPLPSDETLLRNWKRWESGAVRPDGFYAPLIARTFGTVTSALFPPDRVARSYELLSNEDTLEIISRLQMSDVSGATLDALRITVDRLCSEYPHRPPQSLHSEVRLWLGRLTGVLERRLTLAQHREVLNLSCWLALLAGCLEYDMGWLSQAEATRRAALALASQADDAAAQGWAYEMRAWFALTTGDFRGAIDAASTGRLISGNTGVAVQLAAQSAKAWARIGERSHVQGALEQGRTLLEQLPHAGNLDNHFVVDPSKYDFYAMDCYRTVGDNQLAQTYAEEVLRAGTAADGSATRPMRNAEAQVTLGVVAARRGDVDLAVHHGQQALTGDRRSIPSLLMCSRELAAVLRQNHGDEPAVLHYVDQVSTLADRAT